MTAGYRISSVAGERARILRLQATAWWSWSDSNQPPECYGIWACPTSSPGRTPGLELEEAAVDGHFYKRESRVAVTRQGKSRCSPHDGSLLPPRRHHHWALPLLLRQPPTTGEVLLSVPGVRQRELVGHPPHSITLWWLVRVRPAPPPSRLQPARAGTEIASPSSSTKAGPRRGRVRETGKGLRCTGSTAQLRAAPGRRKGRQVQRAGL